MLPQVSKAAMGIGFLVGAAPPPNTNTNHHPSSHHHITSYTHTQQLCQALLLGHGGEVWCLAFHPTRGHLLASGACFFTYIYVCRMACLF